MVYIEYHQIWIQSLYTINCITIRIYVWMKYKLYWIIILTQHIIANVIYKCVNNNLNIFDHCVYFMTSKPVLNSTHNNSALILFYRSMSQHIHKTIGNEWQTHLLIWFLRLNTRFINSTYHIDCTHKYIDYTDQNCRIINHCKIRYDTCLEQYRCEHKHFDYRNIQNNNGTLWYHIIFTYITTCNLHNIHLHLAS